MFYDMHVHSKLSTDSSLDMEEAVVKAINLGLTGIAFTDHLDIDFTDYEDEFHWCGLLCSLIEFIIAQRK